MKKLLITNIIIGSLFGIYVAFAIKFFMDTLEAMALVGYYSGEPLSKPFLYMLNMSSITLQGIIGFVLSIPVMVHMWKQTKKINDKSILFLGGPIISIFAVLFYYGVSSMLWAFIYKETPYILVSFVLFYSFLQKVMYDIVNAKQKV